jgi:hypothetical protein
MTKGMFLSSFAGIQEGFKAIDSGIFAVQSISVFIRRTQACGLSHPPEWKCIDLD